MYPGAGVVRTLLVSQSGNFNTANQATIASASATASVAAGLGGTPPSPPPLPWLFIPKYCASYAHFPDAKI
jgi:hypothetical protein